MTRVERMIIFRDIISRCDEKPFLDRWFFGDGGVRLKPTSLAIIKRRASMVRDYAAGLDTLTICAKYNYSRETVSITFREALSRFCTLIDSDHEYHHLLRECEKWGDIKTVKNRSIKDRYYEIGINEHVIKNLKETIHV